eukprot:4250696-Ditylum_brightwellii.AAC.1
MIITIIDNRDATKIQALIQGFLSQQQLHFKSSNLPDPATKQGHLDEMQHLGDILCSFNSDLNVITNKFQQLLESSRDINPDHDIIWPQH